MRVTTSSFPLLFALATAAGCGGAELATGAGAGAVPGVPAAPVNAGRVATVMTRNLYLGANLSPVFLATSHEAFAVAATDVWSMVTANDFSVRAVAIADEIARGHPDVVGLQEVYLWETLGTDGQFRVAYDHLALLLGALAARGLVYEPVVTLPLFTFTAPTANGPTVRMLDRRSSPARSSSRCRCSGSSWRCCAAGRASTSSATAFPTAS